MNYLIILIILVNGCGAYKNKGCYLKGEECSSEGRPGRDGNDGRPGKDAPAPENCIAVQTDNGATITCAGDTVTITNGSDGQTVVGPKGDRGDAGESIKGDKGDSGDSIIGPAGTDGIDGTSCTVLQEVEGATISCSDGTSAYIENGSDGADGDSIVGPAGADGIDGQNAVLEVIDPCEPGGEILLRLASSQLVAHYSDGNRQYLTLLYPGNWRTTQGGTECYFTVHADLTVTW